MASDLEQLPYRKRFPHPMTPYLYSYLITYFGLVAGCGWAFFMAEVFGPLSYGDFFQIATDRGEEVVEPWITRVTFCIFVHPWWGLLWGAFVGLLLALELRARIYRHLDWHAERMIRRQRIKVLGFSSKEVWWTTLTVLGTVTIAMVGSYVLYVSVKATLYGLLIPQFLTCGAHRKAYALAKEKYATAIQEGTIPEGSLRTSGLEVAGLYPLLGLSLLLPVAFVSLMVGLWPTMKELHESMVDMSGFMMSPDQAQDLERELIDDPDNFDDHLRLTSYYRSAPAEVLEKSEVDIQAAYNRHVNWLIEHHPESIYATFLHPLDDEVYTKTKELWLEQVRAHADNPKVLANAARFFEGEDNELAVELLRKAKALEPDNPEWDERISELGS